LSSIAILNGFLYTSRWRVDHVGHGDQTYLDVDGSRLHLVAFPAAIAKGNLNVVAVKQHPGK
jgi:hypothetical protein